MGSKPPAKKEKEKKGEENRQTEDDEDRRRYFRRMSFLTFYYRTFLRFLPRCCFSCPYKGEGGRRVEESRVPCVCSWIAWWAQRFENVGFKEAGSATCLILSFQEVESRVQIVQQWESATSSQVKTGMRVV